MESNTELVRPAGVPAVIDLKGPRGNVYYLITIAHCIAGANNMDCVEIEREMKQSDYDNALVVFEKHFGSIVTLER